MAGSAATFIGYVGAHVRRLRLRHGLRQEDLAERCGWDYRHVQRIEAGDFDSISALVRVADALGVAPSALLRPTKPVERRSGRPRKKKPRASQSRP